MCLYRPPRSEYNDDLILFNKLSTLASSANNLIIAGDFNFPQISWPLTTSPEPHDSESHFVDLLLNSNLTQMILEPTRFRINQEPSTLDLIITNEINLFTPPVVNSPVGKSDHGTINTSIQFFVEDSTLPTYGGTIKTTNYDLVARDLSMINWRELFGDATNPIVMWDIFFETVSTAIRQNTRTKKKYFNKRKPWISAAIVSKIKRKRNLWKKYRRTSSRDDFMIHKNFSQRLSSEIKNSRNNYEEAISSQRCPKKLHKHIRSTLNSNVSIPLLKKPSGEMCTSETDSAEVLSNFFTTVFLNEPTDDILPIIKKPSQVNSLDTIEFTPEKIEKYIKKIKNGSSPGLDGLNAQFLKKCCTHISLPLSIIMQASFDNHVLPNIWKQASITPIFKKGDKLCCENYRPISLVPIVSKIMESIIRDEMFPFLLSNRIIPQEQHGFVPGRSVITNLLQCLSDWSLSLDSKHPVDVIYLDFAKAFDRVPRRRLLHKLHHFGIRKNLLSWINAFLSDRTFCVRVGNHHSVQRPVLSGVPQGSVLGPLLFLVFASDLVCHINSRVSLYADDTKLYANPSTDHALLQQDLHSISKWCEEWMLPLNASKCVVLHLGKNNPLFQYSINNTLLKSVSQHNDLGVIITKNLSWSEHIVSVCKKANSMLYLLNKTFSKITSENFIRLYKWYVRPLLEFASPVWSANLVRDRNLLENLQRRATRLKLGRIRPSYDQRLRDSNITTFLDRKLRGDLIITYRALNNKLGCNMSNLFTLNPDYRLRGHALKLKKEKFNTLARQFFLSNRIFSTWNSLPASIINAPSVNAFKNRYDAWHNGQRGLNAQ